MNLKNNPVLKQIIKECDSRSTRLNLPHVRKNFTVTQDNINKYGWNDKLFVSETLTSLSNHIEVEIKYASVMSDNIQSFCVWRDDLPTIQKLYGQESSIDVLLRFKDILMTRMNRSTVEWLKKRYYQKYLSQVNNGTIPKLYNTDETLDILLNHIATNETPTFMRVFSANELGNSKTFEKNYKEHICSILKNCPDFDDAETSLSNNDVLRHFNILTYNNTMEFKGPICYQIEDKTYKEDNPFGIIWNTDTLLHVAKVSTPAKNIITIENKANFYATQYDSDILYIFVHGYLSPVEQSICKQIKSFSPDSKYYHFGDLDYGGINIYKFLKYNIFPSIQPLKMNAEAYMNYLHKGIGLQPEEKKLQKLKEMTIPDEMKPIRDLILFHKMEFEQELEIDRTKLELTKHLS